MEHGAEAKEPIASEIAIIGSNKLLHAIKDRNVQLIKELVTKDPEHPNRYIVPVEKIHLTAARAIQEEIHEPFTTPNSILKLLEKVYQENKQEELAKGSVQRLSPALQELAKQPYVDL